MSDEVDFRGEVFALAGQIKCLHARACAEYAVAVDDIIWSGSRDTGHIERTLDGLLDFCGDHPCLQLYRRLCRHYCTVDPAATVSYVNAYRTMYESGGDAEANR